MKRFLLTGATLAILSGGLPLFAPDAVEIHLASAQQADSADDENLDAGSPPVATDGDADAAAETLDQGAPTTTGDATLTPPPSDTDLAPPANTSSSEVVAADPTTDTTVAPITETTGAASGEPALALHPTLSFPFNHSRGVVVQAGQGVTSSSAPLGFASCSYRVSNGKAFVGVHCEPPTAGASFSGFPFTGFPFDSAPLVLTQTVSGTSADESDATTPARKKNRPVAASSDTNIVGRGAPPVVQGAKSRMVGDTLVVQGEDTGLTRTRQIFKNAGTTIKNDEGGDNNVKVANKASKDGKKNKKNKKNKNKNSDKQSSKQTRQGEKKNGKSAISRSKEDAKHKSGSAKEQS